jgi:carbon monoxide dehydrogenase subunit G
MELTNEFRVGVPVEHAWAVLTDVERIAPCLPGAQLQEVEGDQYRGIKVGPITAQYKGAATFVEQDEAVHRVVLRAEGRDTRGQGNANATITATMEADGDGTAVKVVTDLTITGKVAQFGRGVLGEVSAKLMGQFVENLERDVLSDAGGAPSPSTPSLSTPSPSTPSPSTPAPSAAATPARAEPASPTSAPHPSGVTTAVAADAPRSAGSTGSEGAATDAPAIRRVDHPEPDPVDLVGTAGSPVAKRLVPPVVVVVSVLLVWRLLRRRARRGS